ncbi:MAG: LytR C-terminal domain-containing protein [Gemmatimonadetes bacterium]|nr:LytR C-terminal domain-containing protein [Gemmatimonadota bacterium]
MKRFQTAALFVALLVVAGLVGSLVAGIGSDRKAAPAPPEKSDVPAARTRPGERVRVEVLNASGISGLARQATRTLRDRGFDVVSFGNAKGSPGTPSVVIDRVGKQGVARSVADALQIADVRSRPDTALYVEVTVVLGRDWKGAAAVSGVDSGTVKE